MRPILDSRRPGGSFTAVFMWKLKQFRAWTLKKKFTIRIRCNNPKFSFIKPRYQRLIRQRQWIFAIHMNVPNSVNRKLRGSLFSQLFCLIGFHPKYSSFLPLGRRKNKDEPFSKLFVRRKDMQNKIKNFLAHLNLLSGVRQWLQVTFGDEAL